VGPGSWVSTATENRPESHDVLLHFAVLVIDDRRELQSSSSNLPDLRGRSKTGLCRVLVPHLIRIRFNVH
jgi:hypothetical protein